ncbi:tetratricopeptide repeat protein [Aurantiacibacter marinus]|uniref:Tetratricopeptide repeat protein n=1 Tax=Aurantiacibacter marinus TaxID=874156 RepID=A0A0H0XKF5_9SPHN|nr:hypothetical protein [Aurantiacibacter marinus]KLI63098.1 hypothetical protein AAV99_10330 [Aurantiacibacter marinus]
MKNCGLFALGAALLFSATGAQAETLRVAGVYPAASDGAIEIEAISVERFAGSDGPRLSYLIEDRLRGVDIGGEPWFTVLAPQFAQDADGVLDGYAEARFSEYRFPATRTICRRRDAENVCIEYRDVETECIRLSVSLEPQMRLVTLDGRMLWSSNIRRSSETSFCPEFDQAPDFEPVIAGWVDEFVAHVRSSLAPRSSASNVRIMEGRRGLDGEYRALFRTAVALTDTDENAACDLFETLRADNPDQPSLVFNAGLCAERDGDLAAAQDIYRVALSSSRSDDEAQDGLRRLSQRLRAERQLDRRERLLALRYPSAPLIAASR